MDGTYFLGTQFLPNPLKRLTSAVIITTTEGLLGSLALSSADAQSVPTRLGDLTLENVFPSRQNADRL